MKQRIFLFLIIVLSQTSCVSFTEEENNADAQAALVMYSIVTDYGMSKYVQGLDLALKVNEYIEAQGEERYDIEDLYFPNSKIRSTSDGDYAVLDQGEKYVAQIIRKNDKSLTQSGAVWNLVIYPLNTVKVEFEIQNVGSGKYRLYAERNNHLEGEKELLIKDLDLEVEVEQLDEQYIQVDGFNYKYVITEESSAEVRAIDGSFATKFEIKQELHAHRHTSYSYAYWGGIGYYDGLIYLDVATMTGRPIRADIHIEGEPLDVVINVEAGNQKLTATIKDGILYH